MGCKPTSQESLMALRRLRNEAAERGDECLSVLLAGVEVYASLGREYELLETMRDFVYQIREAVENTPTAAELERLFQQEDLREDRGRY
ncbi:MAG: hypothetical protein ACK5AZ_00355 [Bryobacteraceae bacterium]